jgi:hypothetical protein
MEEEKARQDATKGPDAGTSKAEPMSVEPAQSAEDAMLAQALAMSMGGAAVRFMGVSSLFQDTDVAMEDLSEEDQLARALQMSMDASVRLLAFLSDFTRPGRTSTRSQLYEFASRYSPGR